MIFMHMSCIAILFLIAVAVAVDGFAVVEIGGSFPVTPYSTRKEALSEIAANIQAYESIALAKQHSSVIVFPEYGLYGPNFQSKDSILPYLEVLPEVGSTITCSNDTVLTMISCLSSRINATVVVNMGEVVWFNNASKNANADDRKQFNVNVVVTPSGLFVAKYRKQHLYYEPAFDAGINEYSTHPATFYDENTHLTYGLVICNDLTYQATMESIVAVSDVVIGPSWWVNLPPLMSGNSYFSSLSLSYNTTIAVAGCGMGWYCSGSGIYSRGKALGTFYNSDYVKQSKLVEVEESLDTFSLEPKPQHSRSSSSVLVKPPFLSFLHSAADSNSTLLRFTPQYIGESFAYSVTSPLGLVCNVSGVIKHFDTDPVSLAVVSIRGLAPDLGFPQWGIEFCGVVACPTDDCLSTLVLSSNVTLSQVSISANFNVEKYRLFPILLESDGMVVRDTVTACESIDLVKFGSLQCKNVSNNDSDSVGSLSISLLGMEIQ